MEVLYRKYRPKKFSEIVGQDSVKRVLMNAVENNEVSHAYIFAGPRGTGKTTTARILAKALNCENRDGAEPCGRCYACRSIDDGTYMDVVELDAASNRGIDEIRRIRDAASFRPIEGKYKVYIIDEVHMLTREAFNALLKTLEEPPDHVVFILATTNLEKVPATIVSRCQVLEFRNLSDQEIYERLKYVCEKEKINATEEALKYIAKKAMGGMRDALTMLEQVWRFSGNKIDIEDVEKSLGFVSLEIVKSYVNSIVTGDVNKLREVIDNVHYSGKEMEVLVNEAIDYVLEEIHNGRIEYIPLARELMNLIKDLKTFENKKIYTEVYSLSVMKKVGNLKTAVEETKDLKRDYKEVSNAEQGNIEATNRKEEFLEEDIFNKVVEYLKEEGDLSLFVALSMADEICLDDKIFKIIYSKGKEFQYEVAKQKIVELEDIIKKVTGKSFEVEVEMKESSKKVEEVERKIMTLFGDGED